MPAESNKKESLHNASPNEGAAITLYPIDYVKISRKEATDDNWGSIISEITLAENIPAETRSSILNSILILKSYTTLTKLRTQTSFISVNHVG